MRVERDRSQRACAGRGHRARASPAEFLPHVFERFRQGDSSNTRSHGGLGPRPGRRAALVELHGGQVDARQRRRGQGATFTVTLPLARPRAAASGRPRARPREPTRRAPLDDAPRLDGVRVLVVDDGDEVREVVARILRQCGAEVQAVATAADALDRPGPSVPDVLVSEIEMEGETGYSLLRKVRALPADRGRRACPRPPSPPTAAPRTGCGRCGPGSRSTWPSPSSPPSWWPSWPAWPRAPATSRRPRVSLREPGRSLLRRRAAHGGRQRFVEGRQKRPRSASSGRGSATSSQRRQSSSSGCIPR